MDLTLLALTATPSESRPDACLAPICARIAVYDSVCNLSDDSDRKSICSNRSGMVLIGFKVRNSGEADKAFLGLLLFATARRTAIKRGSARQLVGIS